MTQLGRNPALVIPACLQFVEEWSGYGRPARIVGEPLWQGRFAMEVLEWQLHEALMNLAVDPEVPMWVLFPYDAGHLDADVLAEASRSHPALASPGSYQGNRRYRGHDHAQALFATDLPRINGRLSEVSLARTTMAAAVETVILQAVAADLESDLADVARRLAGERLHRGAGNVTVRIWDRPGSFTCEVADNTMITNPLIG